MLRSPKLQNAYKVHQARTRLVDAGFPDVQTDALLTTILDLHISQLDADQESWEDVQNFKSRLRVLEAMCIVADVMVFSLFTQLSTTWH